MNGTICPFGSARCTPLTTPADTLFSKPNGEPIAITHSPRFTSGLADRSSAGRFFASILMSAMSVRLSVPIDLRRELAAIGELDGDFGRAVDDVRVGHDVAVGLTMKPEPMPCVGCWRICGPFGSRRSA